MTDDELRAYAEECRKRAAPVGSMSALWDVITDIEQILAGRPSIMSREELVKMIQREELK